MCCSVNVLQAKGSCVESRCITSHKYGLHLRTALSVSYLLSLNREITKYSPPSLTIKFYDMPEALNLIGDQLFMWKLCAQGSFLARTRKRNHLCRAGGLRTANEHSVKLMISFRLAKYWECWIISGSICGNHFTGYLTQVHWSIILKTGWTTLTE